MTPSILVVVPVLNRPHRVRPLLESFLASKPANASTYLLFVVSESDTEEFHTIEDAVVDINGCWYLSTQRFTKWSQKINLAYRTRFDTDWLLLGADDLHFHPGWDTAPADLMADEKIGVIGTNDLGNPLTISGTHSTHPLVRRSYVERYGIEEAAGIVVPECYHHNYPDTELIAIAKKRGAYAHCPTSVIEHLHPLHKKAEDDDTYRLGRQHFNEDRKLFFARASIYKWPLMGHLDPVAPEPVREASPTDPMPRPADRQVEPTKRALTGIPKIDNNRMRKR